MASAQLARLGFGGGGTAEAVQRFQEAYGVEPTGALGPTTLDMLEKATRSSITLDQFLAIGPNLSPEDAQAWLPYLNASFIAGDVTTRSRQEMYLAQLAHETDGFNTLEEYASGHAYEGYAPLGNTQSGDGARFKGRGGIQLTGRANYAAASERLGVDLVNNPELAKDPRYAFLISADFWKQNGLNQHADRGDFEGTTDVINYHESWSRRQKRRDRLDTVRRTLGEGEVQRVSYTDGTTAVEQASPRGPTAAWTTGRPGGRGEVTSRSLAADNGPQDWLTHHSDRSNSWAANNIRNSKNQDLQAYDFTFERLDSQGQAIAGSAQGLELIVPADSKVVDIQKSYRGSGGYGMFIALEDVETGLRTSIHHLDSVGAFSVGQVLKGGTVFGTQGGSGSHRHEHQTHVDIVGTEAAVQTFVRSNQTGTFRTRKEAPTIQV